MLLSLNEPLRVPWPRQSLLLSMLLSLLQSLLLSQQLSLPQSLLLRPLQSLVQNLPPACPGSVQLCPLCPLLCRLSLKGTHMNSIPPRVGRLLALRRDPPQVEVGRRPLARGGGGFWEGRG